MATYTISNILNGPTTLLHPIDNSSGKKKIAIKSITIWIGWYNIPYPELFRIFDRDIPCEVFDYLKDGLRNIDDIQALFDKAGAFSIDEAGNEIFTPIPDIMEVDRGTGRVHLKAIKKHRIEMGRAMAAALGIEGNHGAILVETGNIIGSTRKIYYDDIYSRINMWPKTMNIHLKQLSANNNILDGDYSTILNQISPPVGVFGDSFTINYEKPIYKDFMAEFITELDFEVITPDLLHKPLPPYHEGFNLKTIVLNNHDLPISVELEIIN